MHSGSCTLRAVQPRVLRTNRAKAWWSPEIKPIFLRSRAFQTAKLSCRCSSERDTQTKTESLEVSTSDKNGNGNGASLVESSSNGASPVELSSNGADLLISPSQTDESVEPWLWEDSQDAVVAYGVLFGLIALGMTPVLPTIKFGELFYFMGLATTTIYIGAHRSLGAKQRQQITVKEGALAPILASGVLFGGYLLIKFFPNLSLQTFINLYFGILGTGAVAGAASPLFARFPFADALTIKFPKWLAADEEGEGLETPWTSLVAVGLGFALVVADVMCEHQNYTLNNILACLIVTDILQLLGLRSFKTAAVLLVGLLCYDVFWVFGSPKVVGDNVMLTVATSNLIEGPFKLLFPRAVGGMGEGAGYPFSLLGLGDVAVPGFLACLALRYDATRSIDMKARAVAAADAMKDAISALKTDASDEEIMDATQSAAFEAYDNVADEQQRQQVQDGDSAPSKEVKPPISDAILSSRTYFNPTLAAYAAGLLVAFGANAITRLGQPALLYLVPFTLGTIGVKAASRNELGRLWDFRDAPTRSPLDVLKEKEKEEKEKKENEKNGN
ncbi:hypothetical protein BSKO_01187 [Bryopsis sp. KO-2023]|nr:hypothetical protein BSKO_01187 [Bryopsis sp. KO-2023]